MPNELEYLHGVDETQVHDFCNPVRYCGSCGALIKKDSKNHHHLIGLIYY